MKNARKLLMDHACCASFERVTVNGESARVVQLIKAGGGETVSVACALTAGTRVLVAQMIVLPGVNDETSPLALTVPDAPRLMAIKPDPTPSGMIAR